MSLFVIVEFNIVNRAVYNLVVEFNIVNHAVYNLEKFLSFLYLPPNFF